MAQASIATLVEKVAAAGPLAAYRGVTFAGAYPSAGGPYYGVTRNAATKVGEIVPVDIQGTSTIETGGTVTAGGPVKFDATGRVVDQGGSGTIAGRALGGATAAASLIEVELFRST